MAVVRRLSSEKRNGGFAPIRRGLLPHLPLMSGNGVKLYVWFHLRAYWSGPKRGWVEASFEDMERGTGWNRKMLQRTIKELEARPYIEVERAANQYELTRVKILRYDLENHDSAEDTGVHSTAPAEDIGEDTAQEKIDHTTVLSNARGTLIQNDLSAHKKSKKYKKGEEDAVRRHVDAEPRAPVSRFSPSAKRENLEARLAAKIAVAGDTYQDFIEYELKRRRGHPFGKEAREAFEALKYEPDLNSPLVSVTFVHTVMEVYQENRGKGLSPGVLCCKVIDHLERYRKEDETLTSESGGVISDGYFYPPDFGEHRDWLRAEERAREQSARATREVRA